MQRTSDTKFVLLLGSLSDSHITRVNTRLQDQHRCQTAILDYAGSKYNFSMTRLGAYSLSVDGQRVPEDAAVYDRVLLKRGTSFYPEGDIQEAQFVAREYRALYSLVANMTGNKIVNPPSSKLCVVKPFQQRAAAAVGFRVPRTIVSNSRADLLRFAEQCDSHLIIKPLSHGMLYEDTGRQAAARLVLTNRISASDIAGFEDGDIASSPSFLQEEIEKSHELRVVYLPSKIFVFKISSQNHEYSQTDWRRLSHRLQYEHVEIPDGVATQIHHLMSQLGMTFGCLDFVVGLDGAHWFLECNNQGAWAWLDDICSGEISAAIAQHLAA